MPITYTIDSEKYLISIEASGTNSDQDWIDLFARNRNDPEKEETMNCFIDTTNHDSVISTNVLINIIQRINSKDTLVKYAVLCSRTVSVGVTNMANALIMKKNIEVRAFTEKEEAFTWLSG